MFNSIIAENAAFRLDGREYEALHNSFKTSRVQNVCDSGQVLVQNICGK